MFLQLRSKADHFRHKPSRQVFFLQPEAFIQRSSHKYTQLDHQQTIIKIDHCPYFFRKQKGKSCRIALNSQVDKNVLKVSSGHLFRYSSEKEVKNFEKGISFTTACNKRYF